MSELNVKENNGHLYVGENNIFINNLICLCGSGNKAITEVSENRTSKCVLPRLQLNGVDINVPPPGVRNFEPKICLCAVSERDSQVILEKHLSRLVVDLVRNNKYCTHFEVQLKVTTLCEVCRGSNVETTYASQEFECTLTSQCLNANKELELRRVQCQPQVETPFQAFLNKSQNIIKSEGNFIRIISKICENGKKVKIKLRFDVRSSVIKSRRSKSFSGFETMKFRQKSNSFGNISQISRFSKSNASLVGRTQSAITILDGEVNIDEHERSEPENEGSEQELESSEQDREGFEQERGRSGQVRERFEPERGRCGQEREGFELERGRSEQEREEFEPERGRSRQVRERFELERGRCGQERERSEMELEIFGAKDKTSKQDHERSQSERQRSKQDPEISVPEREKSEPEREGTEGESESSGPERERCKQDRQRSRPERERSEPERRRSESECERSEPKREGTESERERSEPERGRSESERRRSGPERKGNEQTSMQEPLPGNAKDQVEVVNRPDLKELEKLKIFATGKFGPMYKVTIGGRQQLVKIVKTRDEGNEAMNENFLKEAKAFLKCRHPYVRPTADIKESQESLLVYYWFVDGPSLFEAIESNAIGSYVTYCRVLFGMVKGLVYLQEKIGIECQYLSPEKVRLDSHFNPRIASVGLAYFKSKEDEDAADFHRSLCYLDVNLRSRKEIHSKNVLWSVGRCIWDMLFAKMSCQGPGQDLLSEYNIFACLEKSCNDNTIKSSYFSEKIRKIVYGAGWPRDKEITKSLVVCAVKCMWSKPEERLSLKDLHKILEAELSNLQKKVKFTLYEDSTTNLCLYCLKNNRDTLRLTCGCTTACIDCFRDNGELDCPEHGKQYSEIGHPRTYGVIIQGEFCKDGKNKDICANDSAAMENLLSDQDIFAIKNTVRIQPKSLSEARDELKRIKTKITHGERKTKHGEKYPKTLLLHVNGHCSSDGGNLKLPDGSNLKKKILSEFITDINPKHLIVLVNGHYSEKLVKYLSQTVLQPKAHFTSDYKFFGLFSNAGSMCGIADRSISDENSILIKFILDIFKKAGPEDSSSSNIVGQRYLTAGQLANEISKRIATCNKQLTPIDRYGGTVPIAYI